MFKEKQAMYLEEKKFKEKQVMYLQTLELLGLQKPSERIIKCGKHLLYC